MKPSLAKPLFPTPSPSCFSGLNTVEVQHVGHILLSNLKIGDFVKSESNRFTQVYGFGHFDQNREEEYLQLHFFRNEANQTSLPVLEKSQNHLLFVEKIKTFDPYPIRASDVVVGDI
jgi:hypothetical protein